MAFDTNLQTTPATTPSRFDEDPHAALKALFGDTPWRIGARLPALDAPIEEIEKSGLFAALETREAYLDWVAQYKSTINAAAGYIRTQKRLRRGTDDHTSWAAASNARSAGEAVTVAIAMRRLGKRWSAARAEAARAANDA